MNLLIKQIRQEVKANFPQIKDLGVFNCRPKNNKPGNPWSKHAWSEAWDIGTLWYPRTPHFTLLDQVAQYLADNRQRLRIILILWRSASHWDHIHVEVAPYRGRDEVPPCAGGDDEMSTKGMQTSMKAAGYYTGRIDGDWGPKTQGAFDQVCRDAKTGMGGPTMPKITLEVIGKVV